MQTHPWFNDSVEGLFLRSANKSYIWNIFIRVAFLCEWKQTVEEANLSVVWNAFKIKFRFNTKMSVRQMKTLQLVNKNIFILFGFINVFSSISLTDSQTTERSKNLQYFLQET